MSAVASAFTGLVPRERLLTGPDRDAWSVAGGTPGAVAFAVSDDEVAGLLARASEEGLRVVPAGAGTALATGGHGRAPDLVLSTARMTGITEYEPADLTLTARAGLTLKELDRATRANDQWLPLDPPGWEAGTLGGLLATGSAGPLQAEFGTPRDHVLGLTLVTGDGRVLEVGGRVVKNVAGYDLVRLATGSRGTLGVITRATVRLHPVPEADASLLFRATSLEDLIPAARSLATAPVTVSSLELAEPDPGGDPGALLAVRVVGNREAVDHALELLVGELDPEVARSAETRRGPDGAETFRQLTRREAEGVVLRLALLPGRLESLIRVARELVRSRGLRDVRPALAAHVTRGRLRIAFPALPADDDGMAALSEALQDARAELESLGGSLTVVGGPAGLVGPAAGSGSEGDAVARLLAGIEEAFDPAGILPAVGRAP